MPTARELLAFYLEAGVDCALSETPVNRLSEEAAVEEKPAAKPALFRTANPAPAPVLAEPAPAPDAAITSAREIAPRIGLDRSKAYIANIIPWRPPGNRDPSPQETQICLPFIRRQIELVDPDVLVCLGKPSSQAVLDLKDGIMKTRGKWFDYDTGTRRIKAMATFHPAYLLRQPIYKRMTWQDLRAIQKALHA